MHDQIRERVWVTLMLRVTGNETEGEGKDGRRDMHEDHLMNGSDAKNVSDCNQLSVGHIISISVNE